MKSKDKKRSSGNQFLDLTWIDIQEWAGGKILSRGKSYQRSGAVEDLGITAKNELVAWVEGTTRYATKVRFKRGALFSSCTCPYGLDCKHGVAVVIEYLESLKRKKEVPVVASNDERLTLIKQGKTAWSGEADEEWDGNDDEWDGDTDDADDEKDIPSRRKRSRKTGDSLDEFLGNKSHDELIGIIKDVAASNPDAALELSFKAKLSSPSTAALVKTINKEIDEATSEPGWSNHWDHSRYIPDYSHVQLGLQKLYDAGKFDEVVVLGKKFFAKGVKQASQSDDEGETIDELSDSLSVVYKALGKCSLSDVEKIEQAIDWEMADQYSFTEGLRDFWKHTFSKNDWSDVADRLLKRLRAFKVDSQSTDFHRDYERDRLTDQILNALDRAGRRDDKLALCIKEAPLTKSYVRLVTMLRKAGKIADAEKWIREGISATRKDLPGIASDLQKHLLELHAQKRDWPFCAAIQADKFFEYPSFAGYQEVKGAGEKAGVWNTVRQHIITFLNTGHRPQTGKRRWPLPDTGIAPADRRGYHKPSFTTILIEIALFENNLDEALRLFDEKERKRKSPVGEFGFGNSIADLLAEAVKKKYPDRSIGIWKKAAENHINRTSPKEYAIALGYLNRILKVKKTLGKEKEFRSYISSLRAKNVRKKRLVEMLDGLTGKKIIDER
jgi:uncharacterized Zn finger protein